MPLSCSHGPCPLSYACFYNRENDIIRPVFQCRDCRLPDPSFQIPGNQPVISTASPGRLLFIFFLIFITIAVAIVLNANPGVPVPDDGTGTLAGNVSIGPLCPVEPCTLDPDRLASVYAARTIVVSAQGR